MAHNLITLIFLAGGIGSRMGASIPKQFLFLKQQPIIKYSLQVFLNIPEIQEIIVVCDTHYRHFFDEFSQRVKFAAPGLRRQDSLKNGFEEISTETSWICIHDAARPLITQHMVSRLIEEGKKHGAATLGMPMKYTIKECDPQNMVSKTLDRSKLWEIQTPQFLSKHILKQGFDFLAKNDCLVTDDTAIAELLGHPVRLVEGAYTNLKITTPEDLVLAEQYLALMQ